MQFLTEVDDLSVMQMDNAKFLILGGTLEASEIARTLVSNFDDNSVITSLAGSTNNPKPLSGKIRKGGFGGPEGLIEFVYKEKISAVIDATHPFALNISKNAIYACNKAKVPHICLRRSPWNQKPGDIWYEVSELREAVNILRNMGKRVFLSLGPRAVSHFSGVQGVWFLIRVVDPPKSPLLLSDYEIIFGRGPFKVSEEINLFQKYEVDLLITRNSGGTGAYAKIVAARQLDIPVIIIQAPYSIDMPVVNSPEEVYKWINDQLGLKI